MILEFKRELWSRDIHLKDLWVPVVFKAGKLPEITQGVYKDRENVPELRPESPYKVVEETRENGVLEAKAKKCFKESDQLCQILFID